MAVPVLSTLRAADRRATPWKNGGGTTSEIIVRPRDATLETFDWRVSVARVEKAGPFSAFPNVDRTLAVIDGTGLILETTDQQFGPLSTRSDPLRFAGDAPVSARLLAGPITDLNVMSDRKRFSHVLKRVSGSWETTVDGAGDVVLVAIGGRTRVLVSHAAGSTAVTLSHGDACAAERGADYRVDIDTDDDAVCYFALVREISAQTG